MSALSELSETSLLSELLWNLHDSQLRDASVILNNRIHDDSKIILNYLNTPIQLSSTPDNQVTLVYPWETPIPKTYSIQDLPMRLHVIGAVNTFYNDLYEEYQRENPQVDRIAFFGKEIYLEQLRLVSPGRYEVVFGS